MTKRKRGDSVSGENGREPNNGKKTKDLVKGAGGDDDALVTIQIVAGSYDRILHGVAATVVPQLQGGPERVQFADTFLFNAHNSAIRCLALSPPSAAIPGQGQKVMLATGSTDERINIYNVSAHPPSRRLRSSQEQISSAAPRPILENPKNRELGTLLHHSSTVTKLVFPTRSKLLSASEDSSIAVTRTRDWHLLSAIKCPIPKVQGRPSGDTAPFGGTPSGVNDFAVHPSMKLMISVSKGERCMRLWNLVTGKKAGVLNFEKGMLQDIGEGKHSTGEGRKVAWGSADGGDEFAVGFDRNIVVFGMDSRPKCKIMGDSRTKLHEFFYVQVDGNGEDTLLVVSTEDGRVLFLSTKSEHLEPAGAAGQERALPVAKLVAQLGGEVAGVRGRIKGFRLFQAADGEGAQAWYLVSGSSTGKLGVWRLEPEDLTLAKDEKPGKQVGRLLGTYETQNRITCLEAFVMIPRPDGMEDSGEELSDGEASNDVDESDDGSR